MSRGGATSFKTDALSEENEDKRNDKIVMTMASAEADDDVNLGASGIDGRGGLQITTRGQQTDLL